MRRPLVCKSSYLITARRFVAFVAEHLALEFDIGGFISQPDLQQHVVEADIRDRIGQAFAVQGNHQTRSGHPVISQNIAFFQFRHRREYFTELEQLADKFRLFCAVRIFLR